MFRNPKNLGRRHAVQRRRPLSLESLEPRCLLSSYSVVDLGFLPGAFRTSFQDINNAGQIVGSCGEHAVLWTPTTARDGTGAMTDLGIPEGYDVSIAKAISSDARIAGVAGTYDAAAYQPCVWSPGSTTAQVIVTVATSAGRETWRGRGADAGARPSEKLGRRMGESA